MIVAYCFLLAYLITVEFRFIVLHDALSHKKIKK